MVVVAFLVMDDCFSFVVVWLRLFSKDCPLVVRGFVVSTDDGLSVTEFTSGSSVMNREWMIGVDVCRLMESARRGGDSSEHV